MNGIKMPSNILLLSIRPKYAKKIFEGNKKVELRRVRTRLDKGDLVVTVQGGVPKNIPIAYLIALSTDIRRR